MIAGISVESLKVGKPSFRDRTGGVLGGGAAGVPSWNLQSGLLILCGSANDGALL